MDPTAEVRFPVLPRNPEAPVPPHPIG